jgi:putative Mn2+ efflux pump MntP
MALVAVCGNLSAASGRGSPFHSLGILFTRAPHFEENNMIEVIILAVALSMDAFAVSIGLGAKKNAPNLALRAGLFFGIFQALMPFIGYLGGKGVLGWIEAYTHWVAFGLLSLIGAKII